MKLSELFEKKSKKTAWVILFTKDKIILGKRSPTSNNPNLWNFLGGSEDPGESSVQAAVRELKEEVGITANPSDLKQIAKIGEATYFTYKVGSASEASTSNEVSKIGQFKILDLPNNLHSKTQNFFDNLEGLLS
jgi:8-oxo-dGTP pyrophosphatase MutT (NUDIX family)